MLLLDLFCGAGGCSEGYRRAGFEVVGVDIKPQPRYPFEFHQADWKNFLDSHWQEFDVLHASPPCQGYSATKSFSRSTAPLLIPAVRAAFKATNKPSVIENVPGAKKHMIHPIQLRGKQFGLKVIRDRLFETNPFFLSHPLIPIEGTTNSHRGISTGGEFICVAGHNFVLSEALEAMGIDWMSSRELAQAVPPAYTEWIGRQIMALLASEHQTPLAVGIQ